MRILVTGAGGGIGAGVVRLALETGHEVLAHGRRAETLRALDGLGATIVNGDLSDRGARVELARHADTAGIEAVVATHGMSGAFALADLTPAIVARVMQVNAASTIELASLCAESLRRAGGTFVSTSSQAGLRAERENSVYCASKWALVAWAQSAARSQQQRGYAIRALCPGRTDAPMLHEATRRIAEAQELPVEAYAQQTLADVPLGRLASVREIAAAALFLAAPAAIPRPAVLAVTGGEVPF